VLLLELLGSMEGLLHAMGLHAGDLRVKSVGARVELVAVVGLLGHVGVHLLLWVDSLLVWLHM